MFKNQVSALSANKSSRMQKRRKLYQVRKSVLINPLTFAKMHGGSLYMKYVGGRHYFGFSSERIKTHAWGTTIQDAYRNMLRNFHEKLNWLNSKAIA